MASLLIISGFIVYGIVIFGVFGQMYKNIKSPDVPLHKLFHPMDDY